MICESNEQWIEKCEALETTAALIDEKIARFKRKMSKRNKREDKIIRKLSSFGRWLEQMENDIAKVESLIAEKDPAKQRKMNDLMFHLKSTCLSYKKLVDKLGTVQLRQPHSDQAKGHCIRYQKFLEKISKWPMDEEFSTRTQIIEDMPSISVRVSFCNF